MGRAERPSIYAEGCPLDGGLLVEEDFRVLEPWTKRMELVTERQVKRCAECGLRWVTGFRTVLVDKLKTSRAQMRPT